MRFEVETGQRKRTVELLRLNGKYTAVVDGRTYAIDVARAGDTWSLLVHPAGSAAALQVARSYEVTFDDAAGRFTAHVNGRAVTVAIADNMPGFSRRGPRRAGGELTGGSGGPLRIAAPMAGRVVKVLVNVGDAVAARQGIVVVEAMKMENELQAPRAGTVTDIRVTPGALVEARTVLVVIA